MPVTPGINSKQGQTLAKVPIFSGLTETELAFIAPRIVPRRYSASEMIFAEGEPCAGLFVVESGNVRIFKSSANGREQARTGAEHRWAGELHRGTSGL